MKTSLKMTALCLMTALLATGCGRDTKHELLISDAMNSPLAQEVLDPGIKVEFASGGGKVLRHGLVSNKKPTPPTKAMKKPASVLSSPPSSNSRNLHVVPAQPKWST